jgi:dTDP-4-dehydrorhamnose 3,5-epimerase-like enzyme
MYIMRAGPQLGVAKAARAPPCTLPILGRRNHYHNELSLHHYFKTNYLAYSHKNCNNNFYAISFQKRFCYIKGMEWNEEQLKEPRLIDIPIAHDQRGNLSVVEGGELIPFDIKRVYYLYDVPGGTTRGGHAHRKLRQLIIAASGSFDVILDDGKTRSKYSLDRSYHGLYIPTMHWREIENFSSGAVCMVLASEHYDESDYIYEYEDFKCESLEHKD